MKKIQPQIFSALDFTALFLQELKKNHIPKFNQNELEKELYSYRQLEKYKPLFLDFDCRYEEVQLSEAISVLEIIGGVSWVGVHPEVKYIHSDTLSSEEHTALLDQEKVELTKEVASDYIFRKQLAYKSPISLNISVLNPNRNYILTKGDYHDAHIHWNLITDAKKVVEKEIESIPVDFSHYVTYPKNRNQSVPITSSFRQLVEIQDATFAISQGNVNGTPICATLISQSLDKDAVSKMVDYVTLNNSIENVKVYSIKR